MTDRAAILTDILSIIIAEDAVRQCDFGCGLAIGLDFFAATNLLELIGDQPAIKVAIADVVL